MEKALKNNNMFQKNIFIIHNNFLANLKALKIFVNNVSPTLKRNDALSLLNIKKTLVQKEIIKYTKNIQSKAKTDKNSIEIILKDIANIIKKMKFGEITNFTSSQVEILYKSSYIMLISHFDFLLSDLLHYYYYNYPESLYNRKGKNELSISLNELQFCSDLKEAIARIINKEIDKLLYTNLEGQKNYLKDYLKMDIEENIIDWNKINEAMERRNIIVHNDSKINNRYLKNIDFSVIPEEEKNLKEGDRISIDTNYFINIYNEIFNTGIILIQKFWRKYNKAEINLADASLNKDIYDLLLEENWKSAERLGLFGKKCKISNKEIRLILDVNYAQSLKWQDKEKKLKDELNKFNLSTLSPKYALAFYTLKSDTENFYKNIEKSIKIDNMTKEDFMEWPLFREFRKDEDYKEKIDKIFSKSIIR